MKNTTCRSSVAQSGLASRAVGLVSYTIASGDIAQRPWLPDPCNGTFKWFNASYVCSNDEVYRSTPPALCEGWSNFTIDCPAGMFISSITSAFFGRSDTMTCPYGGGSSSGSAAMKNTTCRSSVAQSGLASRAVGLVSYTIASGDIAQRPWLPDPCKGTFKWFNASYMCTSDEVYRSTPPALCDGWSDITIDCPAGMFISSITSAFFGRSDTVTCPYAGGSAAMKNTTCRSSVAQSGLASKAVGLVSYTISKDVGWLPDPCIGTFKWFNASYICKSYANRP